MNSALADYGKPWPFMRYTAPGRAKGQAVAPTAIANDPATGLPWQMFASIQSMRDYEVLALPEGYRNRDACKLYVSRELMVANEKTGALGDRFFVKGTLYEVMLKVDWDDSDLPHFRYKAFKVEQT
jgi:hypothetical protein